LRVDADGRGVGDLTDDQAVTAGAIGVTVLVGAEGDRAVGQVGAEALRVDRDGVVVGDDDPEVEVVGAAIAELVGVELALVRLAGLPRAVAVAQHGLEGLGLAARLDVVAERVVAGVRDAVARRSAVGAQG
jgi:hypothetical protein